jgi:hypothetical protein
MLKKIAFALKYTLQCAAATMLRTATVATLNALE